MVRSILRNKMKNWKKQNKYPRPNKIGQYWRNMQIKIKGEIPFLMEYNRTAYRMSNQEIYTFRVKEVKSRSNKKTGYLKNSFKKLNTGGI